LILKQVGAVAFRLETSCRYFAPQELMQTLALQLRQLIIFVSGRLVECERVGYRCLRPELVLEALPASPDFQISLSNVQL
jgi:hypothetical protein